jgi:hypothetical protein
MPPHNPTEIHTLFRHAFHLGDVEVLLALYERSAKALETFDARRGRVTLETGSVVETYRIGGGGSLASPGSIVNVYSSEYHGGARSG